MKFRLPILTACAVLSCAPAGHAQDVDLAELVDTGVVNILNHTNAVARDLNVDAPPIPEAALRAALEATLPMLENPGDRSGATGLNIAFATDVASDGRLAVNADGHMVLRDARACVPDPVEGMEIAAFQRFVNGEFKGHQCVVTSVANDLWGLHSTLVAEAGDRRLVMTYRLATVVGDEPETSRALGEARLQANVDLARILSEYGLLLLAAAGRDAGRADADVLADSVARIGERLRLLAAEHDEND